MLYNIQNIRSFVIMIKHHYTDGLESQRLTTRFLRPEDVELWCPFVSSKEATEFFPDYYAPENPLPAAERFLSRQFNRYKEKTFGLQALVEKSSGDVVGICGLLLQQVDGKPELEVGYQILPKYWGLGYAPEAAKLFLDFAVEHQLADSIISVIDVGNVKSERVAEKNGLKRDKLTVYSGLDVWVYRYNFKLYL